MSRIGSPLSGGFNDPQHAKQVKNLISSGTGGVDKNNNIVMSQDFN
jgi:hypothetical protein